MGPTSSSVPAFQRGVVRSVARSNGRWMWRWRHLGCRIQHRQFQSFQLEDSYNHRRPLEKENSNA